MQVAMMTEKFHVVTTVPVVKITWVYPGDIVLLVGEDEHGALIVSPRGQVGLLFVESEEVMVFV